MDWYHNRIDRHRIPAVNVRKEERKSKQTCIHTWIRFTLYTFWGCKMHVFVRVPTRSFFNLIYLLLVHSIVRESCAEISRSLSGMIALHWRLAPPYPLSLSLYVCVSLLHTHARTLHTSQWIVPLFRYFARCFVPFFRALRPFWFHTIRQYLILVFKYRPNSIDISHYCVPATHTTHAHIIHHTPNCVHCITQKGGKNDQFKNLARSWWLTWTVVCIIKRIFWKQFSFNEFGLDECEKNRTIHNRKVLREIIGFELKMGSECDRLIDMAVVSNYWPNPLHKQAEFTADGTVWIKQIGISTNVSALKNQITLQAYREPWSLMKNSDESEWKSEHRRWK